MLAEPKCFTRKCVHYWGVLQEDESEESERNHCAAFPNGIPRKIAYGRNKHIRPIRDQDNDIVFERRTDG